VELLVPVGVMLVGLMVLVRLVGLGVAAWCAVGGRATGAASAH
jgi:hypothetical protein